MGLERYWQKRDFRKTAEPHGKPHPKSQHSYVIQKHAASHLHYDFRLELDGVLLSWAVPKGPSLDPKTKRLAMQTEDHPVEYGSFEGTIPKDEYGGGTVMVWDYGTWEPDGDARAQYEKGHLSFRLHGKKLTGSWHLVRTKSRDQGDKRSWLLFKGTDEVARSDGSIVDEQPNSAQTNRTLDEIAAATDRVWRSNRGEKVKTARAKRASAGRVLSKRAPVKIDLAPEALPKAKRARMPASIEPALATLVSEAPAGDNWVHELKFDGYRLLALIEHGQISLRSRNNKDWSARIPRLEQALTALPVESAILDGEIVVLGPDGVSDFQLLQNSLSNQSDAEIVYYVFDLPYVDGYDLRAAALEQRKALLKSLLDPFASKQGVLRSSEHVRGNGPEFHARACEMGLEGIVSKRAASAYSAGRTRDWLKIKCSGRQEFVIVGYTEPSGSRNHIGALLLGTRKARKLVYAGKVGTGFSRRSLQELHSKLAPLVRKDSALFEPPRGAEARGVHWVEPELVAEIEFTCFTDDGRLRHPSFRGLRTDKSSAQVVLEEPAANPAGKLGRRKRKPAAKSPKTTSSKTMAGAAALRHFRLTNADRVLYPEQGITKQELAEYYTAVSEWMLPHVINRPLTLVRCPEGHRKQCFFQKHAKEHLPPGIRPIPIEDKDGPSEYTAIDDVVGLLGLVQMGVLEIHTWGAHADQPERPDLLVFDLDPDPAVTWRDVLDTAKLLRERFEALGLESFVKTTGGKGLHVCVPVTRKLDWDVTKEFCRKFTDAIVRGAPDKYVGTMSKARRKGRIFIDFFRNTRGATFIAPYSTRARENAPVATPLAWDELSPKISANQFTIRNVTQRLERLARDPWANMGRVKQSISAAMLREFGVR